MTTTPPLLPRNAGEAFDHALRESPNHEALVASDARMSYLELEAEVERAAGALYAAGLGKGDVLAVSLPNTTPVVVTFYAAMRLGAIWLGVNQNLAAQEKLFMLDDARASLLLASGDVAQGLDHLVTIPVLVIGGETDEWSARLESSPSSYPRALPEFDSSAAIAYSSGTTGRPKGIVHSHRNILLPGAALNEFRSFGPEMRKADSSAMTILNIQISGPLAAAQAGGTEILMDRVDPLGIAAWIRDASVTAWFGVPAQLYGLATMPEIAVEDLHTLTDVWTGAAFLPENIRAAFEERFGRRVSMTYGLTEAPNIVTIDKGDVATPPMSSGVPLPHVKVEILGSEGEVLEAGMTGEITVKASNSGGWAGLYRPMIGYLHQPDATVQAVKDGTLYTGDLGMLDDVGRLFVHERRNALILRGGANVYPAEVERVILEFEGVIGASVVGYPDERLGQRVAAAIEIEEGATVDVDELADYCKRQLARYKVPERWQTAALPRNALGKVIKAEVRAWFLSPTESDESKSNGDNGSRNLPA
jgi:long-chain acyl-CoA synthetase